MTIGFTGTRQGMTHAQREKVRELLCDLLEGHVAADVLAVHGDCVGADADFARIAIDLGLDVCIRPCTVEGLRAHTNGREIERPKAPMQRNRDIVADATVMIACPFARVTSRRQEKGGTWATIGFTRRAKKPLHIVWPDGEVTRERCDE